MIEYSEQQRVLHSPFDIETHKKTFIHYLEIVISPEGVIEYAVPSHERKLRDILGISAGQMERDYFMNVSIGKFITPIEWLTEQTGYISVWDGGYIGKANKRQIGVLQKLRREGLYEGGMTNLAENGGGMRG